MYKNRSKRSWFLHLEQICCQQPGPELGWDNTWMEASLFYNILHIMTTQHWPSSSEQQQQHYDLVTLPSGTKSLTSSSRNVYVHDKSAADGAENVPLVGLNILMSWLTACACFSSHNFLRAVKPLFMCTICLLWCRGVCPLHLPSL